MKIVVTGRNGQLALSLAAASRRHPKMNLVMVGRPELDLAEPDSIRRMIDAQAPDVVISAAAYTGVDAAESDFDSAQAVNGRAPGLLAAAARDVGAAIVHVSTDYVYDGAKWGFYTEWDETRPVNAYGRSKLAGELAVAVANPHHVILRTAWLHSPHGHNFVRTMLRLAGERQTVRVVCDQYGSPTAAMDLAEAILRMLDVGIAGKCGTYHLAGRGATNWSGLARHVFADSRRLGGPFAHVEDIPSSAFPTPARRPANSRLSSALFEQSFGYALPAWQGGVTRTVEGLIAGAQMHAPNAA